MQEGPAAEPLHPEPLRLRETVTLAHAPARGHGGASALHVILSDAARRRYCAGVEPVSRRNAFEKAKASA